jgi:WD40 repeat protein
LDVNAISRKEADIVRYALLIALLTLAACVPAPSEPTDVPRRDDLPIAPTEPPPAYREPAIPVEADNALAITQLGRLDPPESGVGSVFTFAFAVDSTRLAALTSELLLGWDLLTGELLFSTNRLNATQVFQSLDKTEVYTLDSDGFLRVINGDTGFQIENLTVQADFSGDAAYDPNAGVLAVASNEGQVTLWDPLAREQLANFVASDPRITTMAFSADGAQLIIGNASGSVEIWDWAGAVQVKSLTVDEDDAVPVTRVTASPDGAQIVAATNGDLRVWSAESGDLEHILLTGEGGSNDVMTYTPDGTYVINSGTAAAMNIWDPVSGELIAAIPELGGERTAAAFNAPGDLMLTSVFQGGVGVWNLRSFGAEGVSQISLDPSATIINVGWSPDGRTLALFDTRGSVHIFGVPQAADASATPDS